MLLVLAAELMTQMLVHVQILHIIVLMLKEGSLTTHEITHSYVYLNGYFIVCLRKVPPQRKTNQEARKMNSKGKKKK